MRFFLTGTTIFSAAAVPEIRRASIVGGVSEISLLLMAPPS
jgi:hypothetical protein